MISIPLGSPRAAPALQLSDEQLRAELRARFGHADFRPGQLPVLRSVMAGRPTLAIMPTGLGKSLCFQLPSLLLPGVTLVVSPLVALMKDQVDQLRQRSVPAAFVNSTQSEAERAATERALVAGRFRLLYVAPERFRSAAFRRSLAQVQVSLVAIDEAHCVSEWGHAFRPDYERLGDAVADLGTPRILALTATATRDVRHDIVRALRLRQPDIVVTGFNRPNIHLEFHELKSEAEKWDSILAAVRTMRPAIVYAATRRQAMTLARMLVMNDVRAAPYHAGMEAEARRQTQEAFFRGSVDVVAATNAFGLGVDKSDIRLVLHASIPRSVEAYYQEIGRAGRDGLDACAGLFFVPADVFTLRAILDHAAPPPDLVETLFDRISRARAPVVSSKVSADLPGSHSSNQVHAAMAFLESLGAVDRTAGPSQAAQRYAAVAGRPLAPDDLHRLKVRSFRDRQRLEHMIALARRPSCRRRALLRELGEPMTETACDGCDVCTGARLSPVRSRLPGTQVHAATAWDMSGPASRVPSEHAGRANGPHAEPL